MATMVLGFLGIGIPFHHGSGITGIGFSLFVVVIAALNLVLDFDFIESGSARGVPKYREWYAAFGLMVTPDLALHRNPETAPPSCAVGGKIRN